MFNKRAINLKRKLAGGGISPGIWVTLPSPTACEVISDVGFDWIMVDTEHSTFNPETLQHMLMAFTGKATVPLIRVPRNDEAMIKQALDMGWDGVVTPQTNTVEDARRAVASCRYPPLGNRGFGPVRAGNYGRDEEEYVRFANESVICVIQIEHITGAEQIEDIVRIPGLDLIMVGPNDMSASAGQFRDLKNPVLLGAIDKIFRTAQDAGIPVCTGGASIRDMEKIMEKGCQLVFLGTDIDYLQEAGDNAMKAFREIVNRMEQPSVKAQRIKKR